MVAFRHAVRHSPVQAWQSFSNGDCVAFSRGRDGFLALNRADSAFEGKVQTQLLPGRYANILGDQAFEVDSLGQVQLRVDSISAVALLSQEQLASR